jgi:hypothetical protein
MRFHLLLLTVLTATTSAQSTTEPNLTTTNYSLTSRPWTPITTPKSQYLDVLEGACRFSIRHQDSSGAIIDPFLKREVQYSTPYFAYAVGTLVRAGRAKDLLPHGIAAMEHSTTQFSRGRTSIPDQHGEFFIAVLTESLDIYETLIPAAQLATWHDRLKTPIDRIVGFGRNNWMTYSMKGEWLRYQHGLVSHADAVSFIEKSWTDEQRNRILATKFHLYHDLSSDPDTLSVETVGRGNLLALVADGYDGPSAPEIRNAVLDGTHTTLFLQDPTGQLPANGRTDDHVWADIGYQLGFQIMANREWQAGNKQQAGVYQHASDLVFTNLLRFRHTDTEWAGSFYITKNHFNPSLRVGYQDASQISNYTGSLLFHLAEVYNSEPFNIPQLPTPAEIGGYVLALDPQFDSVMANAGGMQVQMNLRGQGSKSSGNYWTPLGIVRFARPDWDTRLGPSDGALTESGGVTFAPEFKENGEWLRMASLSNRYRADWTPEFVHPALVRGTLRFHPLLGATGPTFETRLWITPDGVYAETQKLGDEPYRWAVTWPLLVNDGRLLDTAITPGMASTNYPGSGDQESFLSLTPSAHHKQSDPPIRSSFGDLLPIRDFPHHGTETTFIYPHKASDPAPNAVLTSIHRTPNGFKSVLGTVENNLYIGLTVAGGEANHLSLPNEPTLKFSESCGFLVQLKNHRPITIETDRDVDVIYDGKKLHLQAHRPTSFP